MADLPSKPRYSTGWAPEHKLRPEVHELTNADGDVVELAHVKIRCEGCTRIFGAIIRPDSPVEAKFKCRMCNYVTHVKTRKEAMDDVEDLIAVGTDQAKPRKQYVYTGPPLKIRRAGKVVHVPGLGKATLIGG